MNERIKMNAARKSRFHQEAMRQLKTLALALGLPQGSYEVRSNKGGPAVSGEITLHAEDIYIQASQPCTGGEGLLIRSCKGRSDYIGGRNTFQTLNLLNDPKTLATMIRKNFLTIPFIK